MANNRLYIGDEGEKLFFLLEKGWGCGWVGGKIEEAIPILKQVLVQKFSERDCGKDTQLFFFTEWHPRYLEIMNTWSCVHSVEDLNDLPEPGNAAGAVL